MRGIITLVVCGVLLATSLVMAQQEVVITDWQWYEISDKLYYMEANYNLLWTIGGYLDTVETKLQSIMNNTDGLEGYLDTVEAKLQSIMNNTDGLEGYLEPMLSSLEWCQNFLGSIDITLTNIQNNTDQLEGYLDTVESKLQSIDLNVEVLRWLVGDIFSVDWAIFNELGEIKLYVDQVEPLLGEIRDEIGGVVVALSNVVVTVSGVVDVDLTELIAEIHTDLTDVATSEAYLKKIREGTWDFEHNEGWPKRTAESLWDRTLEEAYLKKIRSGIWDFDPEHDEGFLVKIRDGTWDYEHNEGWPKRTAEALWDYEHEIGRVEALTKTNYWGFNFLGNLLHANTALLTQVHSDISSNESLNVSGVETSALPDYGTPLSVSRGAMEAEEHGFRDVHAENLGSTNSFFSFVTNRFNFLSGWQNIPPVYMYSVSLPYPFDTTMLLDWTWAVGTLEIIKEILSWALYATAAVGAVLVLRSGIA